VGTRLMKRLWRREGPLVPQRQRKRRQVGTADCGILRRKATMKNEVCRLDFIHDTTVGGRILKMLVVLDEYTCEWLAIKVERTFRAADVVAVLDELTAIRGAPVQIRRDNGPELVSRVIRNWCVHTGTGTLFIEPGALWQNGVAESFNGRLRDELLSSEAFETMAEAKYLVDRRRLHYNHRRPQRALGKVTPAAYEANCAAIPASARSARLRCVAAHSFPSTMHHLSRGLNR
jgi:transposase InsO family protein